MFFGVRVGIPVKLSDADFFQVSQSILIDFIETWL